MIVRVNHAHHRSIHDREQVLSGRRAAAPAGLMLHSIGCPQPRAAFGAGLEPSKEWMDKHVAAFADSQEVQYTENIGELFDDIANAIHTI